MERLGVAISRGLSPTEVVECVQLAEELGYKSAWMTEGHGGDPFSILTACALATNKILLGTSITSVFVRSAPTIAMGAASVDYFSKRRFILGLGSSHKVQVEPEHGLAFSQPVQRLRECVEIVRRLLHDGDVSYNGSVFNIEKFDLWFKPFRREIPIYLAGLFPRMLEICGEIAQGALLTVCSIEHAATAVESVALGARRAGKDPQDVDVATLLPCSISASREKAGDLMRTTIVGYVARFPRYRKLMAEAGFAQEIEAVREASRRGDTEQALELVPTALIEKIALIGTPEECRQRLQLYRHAGIKLPIIWPRVTETDAKRQTMEVIRACAPV